MEQVELVGQMVDRIEYLHEHVRNDLKVDRILEDLVKDDEAAGSTEELVTDKKAYNDMNLQLWQEGKEIGELRTAKHGLEESSDYQYDLWKDSIVEKEFEENKLL